MPGLLKTDAIDCKKHNPYKYPMNFHFTKYSLNEILLLKRQRHVFNLLRKNTIKSDPLCENQPYVRGA